MVAVRVTGFDEQTRLHELYEEHFDLVWAALAVHGVGLHEREDLVQEVWLLAHRRLSRLRQDASARAWLWSITHNIVRRHRRATQRRDRKLQALEAVRRADRSVGSDHEGRVATEQLLAALPIAQREVIVLTHQVGYSGPEIAALLGVSLNTVHSRLRLAKARLREDLATEQPQAARQRCWPAVLAGIAAPPSSLLASTWMKAAAVVGLVLITFASAPQWHADPGGPAPAEPDRLGAAGPRAAPAPTVEILPPISVAAAPHAAAPSRLPSRPKSSPRSAAPPSLSADVQLVHKGLALNRAGRYERALTLFERHARRYPQSPVWDARESGRVRALCALGRVERAKTRARRALARGGSSIAIHNSVASCSAVTSSAGAGHSVSP